MQDAKASGLHAGHLDAADRYVGAGLDMVFQHGGIVLLVDVVASQDENEVRIFGLEDVDVLPHRVGSAPIPHGLVDPLLGR